MTIKQVTRGLVAGSIIGVVLTLIPAAVSAAGTPPPIEDIAAQYGTDTGATTSPARRTRSRRCATASARTER